MNKTIVAIITFLNACSIMQASNLSSDNIENNILNENETASSNNWGVRLKSSNFHLSARSAGGLLVPICRLLFLVTMDLLNK